MNSVLNYNK